VVDEEARFDWDAFNRGHLARHGVTAEEAEQCILDPDAVFLEIQTETGEERTKALGMTSGGRILVVVFALRGMAIRPVTSYDAPESLRRIYFDQRPI
jgi:uncharacterized DUF497 family protein